MILLNTYHNSIVMKSTWYRYKGYFIHPDMDGIKISSIRDSKSEWISFNDYELTKVGACNY